VAGELRDGGMKLAESWLADALGLAVPGSSLFSYSEKPISLQ